MAAAARPPAIAIVLIAPAAFCIPAGPPGPPPRPSPARYSRPESHLYFAQVKQFEIFAGDGVFVALTQETHLIGIFQFFQPGGITPEFLDKMLHCPRILHAAMNQLFLAVPFYLEGGDRQHNHRRDGDEGDKQDERDQNVSALGAAGGNEF